MNELPFCSVRMNWQLDCVNGSRTFICWHSYTHANTRSLEERANVIVSIHFTSSVFIQLAWPTTFTSDSPSSERRAAAQFSQRLFGFALVRSFGWVQISKRITLARQSFCECCVKQATFLVLFYFTPALYVNQIVDFEFGIRWWFSCKCE